MPAYFRVRMLVWGRTGDARICLFAGVFPRVYVGMGWTGDARFCVSTFRDAMLIGGMMLLMERVMSQILGEVGEPHVTLSCERVVECEGGAQRTGAVSLCGYALVFA